MLDEVRATSHNFNIRFRTHTQSMDRCCSNGPVCLRSSISFVRPGSWFPYFVLMSHLVASRQQFQDEDVAASATIGGERLVRIPIDELEDKAPEPEQ
jgi:hypothetical protein